MEGTKAAEVAEAASVLVDYPSGVHGKQAVRVGLPGKPELIYG
jgi:hypothetical protein